MEHQTEFTILGKNIERLSIYYGFFFISLGSGNKLIVW